VGELKKQIVINMEKEVFKGNVLDIGYKNTGIIYNVYKHLNEDANIEYINGDDEKENIKKGEYDSCILLFSFSCILNNKSREVLLNDIYSYLKSDGILYIWDIDKGIGEIFRGIIKILVPDRKIMNIKINNFNVLKDSSVNNAQKLLEKKFKLLTSITSDKIYSIKAIKKELKNEVENQVEG
jgi:hypothetical protein